MLENYRPVVRDIGITNTGRRWVRTDSAGQSNATMADIEAGLVNFRTISRDFVRGKLAQVIGPLNSYEFAVIFGMALLGLAAILFIAADLAPVGFVMLVPVFALFGIWQSLRWSRNKKEMDTIRALRIFDRMVGQGIARETEWDTWVHKWQQAHRK